MFVFNGYVYGKDPDLPVKIVNVKPLADMIIILTFNNGEKRLFDASILNGPAFRDLRDPVIFGHPIIEHGVVTWKNGEIDCAPEYMYAHSYEYAEEYV